jgi:UDP-GlcNAc:undecaprenyl-phosphate GlcNAc-1-phosphate transferase
VLFRSAVIALASGVSVEIVGNDVLAAGLALLWLVGMTNAFNLLDNLDGLAATVAAIACVFFALDARMINENRASFIIALALGLACAGFLPFNVRPRGPALIFMGDSGSQVLGFALGSLALLSSYKVAGTTVLTVALPLLILAVPILDTALVTVVRLLEGRPVHQGGRDHTSHRLVYQGLSEKRALVFLALIAGALGTTSLAYSVLDNQRVTLIGVLLTFAALVQFGSFLGDVERRAQQDGAPWVMRTFALHRRRLAESVVDAALICASFLAAYLVAVDGSGTVSQRHLFVVSLPVVLFARYAAFIPFGLYRGVWRYAGARDAAAVIAAVVVSTVAAYAFVAATRDFRDFPRSVFVLDALLCAMLVGGSRFAERGLDAAIAALRSRRQQHRTLVVGAGRAGRSLLRELRETPGEVVVGFVDDDARLRRRRLQGVPVLGGLDEIDAVLAAARPAAVLVTIPEAPHERLDAVVQACARAGVPCRFVRRQTDLDPEIVLGAAAK